MAWYRCMGSNGGGGSQGGLSDLHVNPYNVENGSYLLSGNAIEYTVSAQTGYEGMSVQLLGLEVGHQYLISFDVKLMNVPTSWAGSYSWKTCIADGTITNYGSGDYGRDTLSEGQYELPTTASKKSYGFLVTPQSAMTTLLFLTARASTGQTVVFNIDNFKMADTAGGSVSAISKTVLISETDFANLSTKEDDTLYEVYHNNFGTQIIERYQGSKRILNHKQDISEYEFWYEDVACIQQPCNKSSDTSEIVNTGITWDDFISHDWQIEFNATSMLNSSESAIIGSNTSGNLEIYFGSTNNLYIYGFGPDRAMTDCNGADIKITFNHTTKETNVYRNDVLIDTFTASASSSSSAYIQLFDYRDNYKFLGIVKYIGFKWL